MLQIFSLDDAIKQKYLAELENLWFHFLIFNLSKTSFFKFVVYLYPPLLTYRIATGVTSIIPSPIFNPYFVNHPLSSSIIWGNITTSYPHTLWISLTTSFLLQPFLTSPFIILFYSIAVLLSLSYSALAFSSDLASLIIWNSSLMVLA